MATQSTLVAVTASNHHNDEQSEAITSVLQQYLEAGRHGDAVHMRPAFRDTATIHGYIDGDLIAGPIQLLFDWVDSNPPASNLQASIVDIDVVGTIATARVEIENWLDFRFTDQFTLLNEDGIWTITSKVFYAHP